MKIRKNIQGLLKTDQPVDLDLSQMDSLIAGLGQSVNLIQGPPGKFINCVLF
jgi:hypothetical protein